MNCETSKKLRVFVGRIGGKSRVADCIVTLIPEHRLYVEPFVGSGAVFFRQESKEEILNDIDKDIYHLWIDMKSLGDKVKNFTFKCNKSTLNKLLKTHFNKSSIDRLYRNLYISKCSFNGNRIDIANASIHKKNVGAYITLHGDDYKQRLQNVRIFNRDYKEMIRRYDSPTTFFYFDPPYEDKKSNPNWGYKPIPAQEIWEALRNIKGRFILSYRDSSNIKRLFSSDKYKIKRITTRYNISGQNVPVTELLILK